eukprot:43758-Prorocentrum_minimum.AAC.5
MRPMVTKYEVVQHHTTANSIDKHIYTPPWGPSTVRQNRNRLVRSDYINHPGVTESSRLRTPADLGDGERPGAAVCGVVDAVPAVPGIPVAGRALHQSGLPHLLPPQEGAEGSRRGGRQGAPLRLVIRPSQASDPTGGRARRAIRRWIGPERALLGPKGGAARCGASTGEVRSQVSDRTGEEREELSAVGSVRSGRFVWGLGGERG